MFLRKLMSLVLVGLYAYANVDLKTAATAQSSKGYEVLKQVLSSKEADVYLEDSQFILDFELKKYNIAHVPSQGYFFYDTKNDYIKNCIGNGTTWEKHIQDLIMCYAKEGSTVIDIGAHIGTHVVSMSKAVGSNGKVFAFEPSKKIHTELCYNLVINQLKNVFPLRAACGNQRGLIKVITPLARNEGGSFVLPTDSIKNSAVLIRLDDLCLDNISLIKIDVENMEKDVLEGAELTIKKSKPVMIIEVQRNKERTEMLNENTFKMREESLNKIKELGYEITYISGDDYLAIPK